MDIREAHQGVRNELTTIEEQEEKFRDEHHTLKVKKRIANIRQEQAV